MTSGRPIAARGPVRRILWARGLRDFGDGLAAVLLLAAALMIATGLGFAAAGSFALVAAVALVGTINPSAGSVSVFAPLEQALLTQASPDAGRAAVFGGRSSRGRSTSPADVDGHG